MDYSQTLQLPKTDFPMRANLPKREPDIQEFWKRTIFMPNCRNGAGQKDGLASSCMMGPLTPMDISI